MTRNFYGTVVSALLIGFAFTACGGTASSNLIITPPGGNPDAGPGVQVVVAPGTTLLQTGLTAGFLATVTGSSDTGVTWSVAEGASGGSVSGSGQYTAPNTAGTYHVVASAHADETKKGSATVTVAAPGVALVPPTALVVTGTTKTFAATVIGGTGGVNWTVQEAGGGTIDANGKYTPPATEGTYHFVATSINDSSKTAVGVATVVKPGHWVNVTPPGVALNGDFLVDGGQEFNYGAQEVAIDPNNPGTAFVAITYQGVWRTQDYGATWTRITDGTMAMDNGRPQLNMAPDGSYIIATLLYPEKGFSNGAWISKAPSAGANSALGLNWTRFSIPGVPGDDMGAFRIDPANGNHVIGQPHTPTGNFYESFDAGQTWKAQPGPANQDIGKLTLVNSDTLMASYDFGGSNPPSPQRGVRSGQTWTWSAVPGVLDEHGKASGPQTTFHGAQQIFIDTTVQPNTLYYGGADGVHVSTDAGAHFTKLNTTQNYSESIVATPNRVYSAAAFAGITNPLGTPNFQYAPRPSASAGSSWVNGNSEVPSAMNNGWLAAGVAQDANSTKWVIVAGCWDAGIFIYVEP
jgi:hypothetical protein